MYNKPLKLQLRAVYFFMFLITSLTVTRSRIVRTKYVSSITITSLPAYFACPLGDDQLAYGVKEGTTAYRLEYAHALNYTIDIEFCQFIHNSPMANFITTLDNNKKWCIIITKDIVSKATGFTKKA